MWDDLCIRLVAVRDEGEAPAGVNHDVFLVRVQTLLHVRQTLLHSLEIGGHTVADTTEIREEPHRVLLEEKSAVRLIMNTSPNGYVVEVGQQQRHASRVHDGIAVLHRVTGNVTQRPCRLLAHSVIRGVYQTNEVGKRSAIHNDCRLDVTPSSQSHLFLRSRSNVGQHPRRFVLEVGAVVVLQKHGEARHQARINHEIDWRVVVYASRTNQKQNRSITAYGSTSHCQYTILEKDYHPLISFCDVQSSESNVRPKHSLLLLMDHS